MNGRRIARIGEHPVGFDTCAYDGAAMKALARVEEDALALDYLFDTARAVPNARINTLHETAKAQLSGLDAGDAQELDRSLRLKAGPARSARVGTL